MSGTTTTDAGASGGQSISALSTAETVAAADTVVGIFGGAVQNSTVADLVAAGIPDTVAQKSDIAAALEASPLARYTAQAQTSANLAAGSAAASQVNLTQAAEAAASAATILNGTQAILDQTTDVSQSATNAVAGVAADANAAKVMLTAGINGNAPLTYLGYWNASTNSPALASGKGSDGDLYIVSVAGTTALDGNASWSVGDGAWFHNGAWQYFARAGWAAVAQTINALQSLTIAGTAGMAAHAGGYQLAIRDAYGFVGGGINSSGDFKFPSTVGTIGPATLAVGALNGGVVVSDALGFVGLDSAGQFVGSYTQPTFSADDIDSYEAANRAYSAQVWRTGLMTGQRPTCDYNGVLSLGQSEQNGEMSIPLLGYSLSSASVGALMIGESSRCADPTDNTSAWEPLGGSTTFSPLADVAWNWSTNKQITRDASLSNIAAPSSITISTDGETITSTDTSVDFTKCFVAGDYIQFSGFTGDAAWMNLTGTEVGNSPLNGVPAQTFGGTLYTQIKALTATTISLWVPATAGTYSGVTISLYLPVDPSLGQDQSVASTIYEAALTMNRPSGRYYVSGNACISGQTLAQLSSGATPNLFQRVGQWAAALVTAAKAANASASCCVHVLPFGQGGSDTTTSYATYLAELIKYASDARAAVVAETGQLFEPFFEMFVISGGNIPYTDSLAVARAQMDAVLNGDISNAYIVGPGYFVPDYYAHWSSNGERWFGALRAKVRKWVIHEGRGWQPCRITSAYYRGAQILLNLHVPFAPLQIKKCWIGQDFETLANYGFSATDSTGAALTIESIAVGETTIVITVGECLTAAPSISYGDTFGSGNICDSDPSIAFDDYVWTPGSGQPLTEDVTGYVNEPYPLQNWLCPTSITAEAA